MAKNEIIEIKPLEIKRAAIFIEGDGDLVLNQMNARSTRELAAKQNGEKLVKQAPNKWEDIITAIHWRDKIPMIDTYEESDEAMLVRLLTENAPCITAFGLKKSFGQAVVQNEIATYSTKFNNAVNVIANKGLVPIEFSEHSIDERLMSPKRGAPVLVRISHFSGWKTHFDIQYSEHVYNLNQIVNIINMAGFGLGIGSGRSSGYGRYHVVDVK